MCGAGEREVGDRAQLGGAGVALLDEGPVGEDVLDHAEHPDAGHAEGEPDRPGTLHARRPRGPAARSPGRPRCRRRRAAPARRCGPCRRRSRPSRGAGVPVEVVLGDVEDRGGLGAHRVGVVQLEAGQLDREHVVRLGVHHRLDDRQADVADRDAAQPGGAQDRVEHLHGGGLAVGAGHAQPRGRRGRGRAAARPARPRPRPGCRGRGPARAAGRTAASRARSTTRSTSSGRVAVAPSPRRTVAPSTSSSSAFSRRSLSAPPSDSSSAVTAAPRWLRLSAAAKPETPKPATTARTPSQESWRPRA